MQQVITTHLTELDLKNIVAFELESYFKAHPLPSSNIDEPELLLTKKQAAKFLLVSHVTLNKLIKEGHLPCYRIGYGTLRIKKSALLKSLVTVRTKSINKTKLGNSS